jgi:hypothetical protein
MGSSCSKFLKRLCSKTVIDDTGNTVEAAGQTVIDVAKVIGDAKNVEVSQAITNSEATIASAEQVVKDGEKVDQALTSHT